MDKNQSIYYSGNKIDTDRDGILNGGETTPYWYQGEGTVLSEPWSEHTTANPVYSAETAWRLVTSQSGALPYDDIDSLVWSQINSLGSAGVLYTSQEQTGLSNNGYGEILGGEKPLDSDNDGMPDYFEEAFGSDKDKDDAMVIGDDGYAHIEKYINYLGAPHATAKAGEETRVDLRQWTSGFQSVAPVYSIKAPENAAVVLADDGHSAIFTADKKASGLMSFQYVVRGNDGSEYAGKVEMLVSKNAAADSTGEDEPLRLTPGIFSAEKVRVHLAEGFVYAPESGFLQMQVFDLNGKCRFRFARQVSAGTTFLNLPASVSSGVSAVRVKFRPRAQSK